MAQKSNKKGKRAPAYSSDTMAACLIVGLLLIALGVLIFLATALGMEGDIFDGLRTVSRGMCGALAVGLSVIPAWGGGLVILSTQRKAPLRPYLLVCLIFLLICTTANLISYVDGTVPLLASFQNAIAQSSVADSLPAYLNKGFTYGVQKGYGGGLLGIPLAYPLWRSVGVTPGAVIVILAAVIVFLFLIRLDVPGIIAKGKSRREERRARQAAEDAAIHQQELAWQQEQQRIRQEQTCMQEQMRQQQIQQLQPQLQPQPPAWTNQPYTEPSATQGTPIVRQVQTRTNVTRNAPAHGFQATPEELGQADTAPLSMPEPARGKKRGGIFNRDKADDTSAFSRKRGASERKEAAADPTPAERPRPANARKAQTAPVAPVTPAEPAESNFSGARRRSPFQRPEPELDVPDFTCEEEPQIFSPEEEAFAPVQPVGQADATNPAEAVAKAEIPTTPMEAAKTEIPTKAAMPIADMPTAEETPPTTENPENAPPENSFLARLRAAKRAAGIDVPQDAAEEAVQADDSRAAGGPPRPAARSAAGQAQSAEADWAAIPPWEDGPAAGPAEPLRPVVTMQKPEGGYEPELRLKPRRSGSDAPGERPKPEKVELPYVYPPMELLKAPDPQTDISPEEDALRARRLENTLQSFRVPAKVRYITHGPAISRFELELAPGIKVSKVTALDDNIAMTMEVKDVRIEAPIPGKSLVGVEIPNKQRANVTLREVLESDLMRNATKPLVVALGKDIAGTPVVCDLAKMPHLLIAGATGSGKSVCINTIINSLLYRCSPKEVRMILVDPKVVELQCYNGIPHLLIPVVSDPQKASGALAWAVGEMMERYKRFQEANVRAIDGYNEQADEEDRMPRIVIIIDELADLMMTCKKDVEERICRLAQLARAAGIHLIVATQRPSVDVITGLIKANIPSRIAFKVTSTTDSRTILDRGGAEQLLGYGDMLYAPTGEFTPIRVQGCFLSDPEVNRITDFLRENCPSDYDAGVLEELDRLQAEAEQGEGSSLPDGNGADDYVGSDEDLLARCIELAVNTGQVSTSFIQRRMRLGFARAARLVDEMHDRGIVGPKDGAKPRMCLISREEYEAMKAAGEL